MDPDCSAPISGVAYFPLRGIYETDRTTSRYSVNESRSAPNTIATDVDILRRVRHVDQRPGKLLQRIRAHSCRCRRAWRRRDSVLGTLGTPEHRPLLGTVSNVSRDLRALARGNIRAFPPRRRGAPDQPLFRCVPSLLPLRRCRPYARPAIAPL